jgi:hypothetical protein
MTFLLLTGAGFSYNWGGPLASDVFSALLAGTSTTTPETSCSIQVAHLRKF